MLSPGYSLPLSSQSGDGQVLPLVSASISLLPNFLTPPHPINFPPLGAFNTSVLGAIKKAEEESWIQKGLFPNTVFATKYLVTSSLGSPASSSIKITLESSD